MVSGRALGGARHHTLPIMLKGVVNITIPISSVIPNQTITILRGLGASVIVGDGEDSIHAADHLGMSVRHRRLSFLRLRSVVFITT